MLDVPIFTQCGDHTFFDRTTACTANGNAHFVMATQAIQFIHIVDRKSRATFDFTCRRIQFNIACGAIEVITVIDFTAETQWLIIDDATDDGKLEYDSINLLAQWYTVNGIHSLALVANVFAQTDCFDPGIAIMAQCPILVSNKSTIGQFFRAHFTAEALRMPIGCHRLDYTSDDKFTAFITAWCKQHVKITFAIFTSFKFVEDAILKGTEALSTPGNRKNST